MSAKVFMTHLGTHCRIGTFGEARFEEVRDDDGELVETINRHIVVPDEVAEQLEREIAGDPPDPRKGKAGVPGRTDIRVEREAPPRLAPTPRPHPAAAASTAPKKNEE